MVQLNRFSVAGVFSIQPEVLARLEQAQYGLFGIRGIGVFVLGEEFDIQLYRGLIFYGDVGAFAGLVALFIEFNGNLRRGQLDKAEIAVGVGEDLLLVIRAWDGSGNDYAGQRFLGNGIRYISIQHPFYLPDTGFCDTSPGAECSRQEQQEEE